MLKDTFCLIVCLFFFCLSWRSRSSCYSETSPKSNLRVKGKEKDYCPSQSIKIFSRSEEKRGDKLINAYIFKFSLIPWLFTQVSTN